MKTIREIRKIIREQLEIRNESDITIWVEFCRSKTSSKHYLHIGTERQQVKHDKRNPTKLLPHDYSIITPTDVIT